MNDRESSQIDAPKDGSLPEATNPVEKKKTQKSFLNKTARTVLAAADYKIKQCNRLISRPEGQDALLASIEYLSHALHHSLIHLRSRRALRSGGHRSNKEPQPSSMLALSSLISEARYTFRLFRAIKLLSSGLSINKNSPRDLFTRLLAYLQIAVLLMYQISENIFYLALKGIISRSFLEKYTRIGSWSRWSARFLLGYLWLQLIKLCRARILSQRSEDDSKEDRVALKGREWWKSFFSSSIWIPLCVHWSLERGIGIPGSICGISGFMAGAWELHDMVKEAGADS